MSAYTCPDCGFEADSKDELDDDGRRGGHADQWWRDCPDCGETHEGYFWMVDT